MHLPVPPPLLAPAPLSLRMPLSPVSLLAYPFTSQDGSYKEKTKSLAEEKDLEEPPAKKSKVILCGLLFMCTSHGVKALQ